MLKKLSPLLSYHLQAASSSLNSLCQRPLSTVLTVIVIAIALTLPGLFWVFTDNLKQLTANWQRGSHISVYLKSGLAKSAQEKVLAKILVTTGVGNAILKSPEEGLDELQRQEGMQDIMRYLPENPLPPVIEVIPSLSVKTPALMEELFTRIKAYPDVEQAKLDMEWISRLYAILGFIAKGAHALMALLACAVVLVIGNTLRLAIHNQHEEIQVLKLIGATDPYIARPFLYAGIWYSLAGAILAVFFINIFMLSLAVTAQDLAAAYQMRYALTGITVKQAYLLVLVSTILGWLGARLSVKGQLNAIEPYI